MSVLDVDPVVPQDSEITVRAEGVTVCYGAVRALDDVSLLLRAGAVTALIGPNGAGKSTLLSVLAHVCTPDCGTVTICCCNQRVAYVLQRSALSDSMPLTVGQAVAMGRWQHRGILGRLGRHDRTVVTGAMDRLGITPLARRQVGELSGGQRQRVLVAQALAQEADVLLFDEPLTGLDLAARERILDVMDAEAARGATVVHTTHDLAEARRAHHVVLLAGGLITTQGPPAEIVRPEIVAAAYGLDGGQGA